MADNHAQFARGVRVEIVKSAASIETCEVQTPRRFECDTRP